LSKSKQYLETALRAANVADAVSLAGFTSREFSVSRKADNSEVTEIDRNTETAISSVLRDAYPEFGMYGEEHGTSGPTDAEFVWVIDPIDGTTKFRTWRTCVGFPHCTRAQRSSGVGCGVCACTGHALVGNCR